VEALGWFWGSIRMMLPRNPQITIRDAMGEGPVFHCDAPECGKMFASKPKLTHNYAEEQAEKRMGKAHFPHRQLFETVIFGRRQEVMVPRQELED
jgi:hypothetical protein